MATDLTSLLKDGAAKVRMTAASRKQALEALADILAEKTGLSARDIFDAAMERERLGSTGVGEGVAIPHARMDGLDAPIGALIVLETGVDFEAVDERPCDLIFMLLAPNTAGADHLRALAQVSRVFRQPQLREKIRGADTDDALIAVLCKTGQAASAA